MDNMPATPRLTAPQPTEVEQKRFPIVTVVIVLLLAIGVGVGLIQRAHRRAGLREDMRELGVPTVVVISPTPGKAGAGPVLPAEVKPFVEAPIYARANGYLKRWVADLGDEVKAGQLLAEIDTPELNQELAQSKAQLQQAEASLELAKITGARWAELLKTSSVSEQEAAEKQADLAFKSATVEAARANVRRLEEVQSFAKVTAPFDGTITQRRTDVGDLIRADSGRELFRLAQIKTLRVYTHIPQSAAAGVRAGQMAEVTFPEMPGRAFPAKIVRTSGALNAETRTLLMEMALDNSKGEILSGSYAQARLIDVQPGATLTLPSNCVLLRAGGPVVGVVLKGNRVEMRHVQLGRDFGQTIEILGGLAVTDAVIANPSDFLADGIAVRVAEQARK